MEATGCGREDAFDRLASCGGHIGNAANRFFSIDAGPSGTGSRSRSPPPPPPVSVSESSSESEDALRARPVVPARRTSRVSRWDSDTRVVVGRSRSSRRRERRRRCRGNRSRESGSGGTPGGDREAREADGNRSRRRRFREFREDIFSDGEEDDEETNSRRRRRLNPAEPTSEGETKKADDDNNSHHRFREDVIVVSSDDDDDNNNMLEELEEAARPAPRNRTFEELFKVPRSLTFKGGFHAAKADADAAADDGEEEAKKVLGYYNIPHDQLPVVVVVDPVTGQAMDVLHGSAACELNDFMVRLGPFTETKPTIHVVMAAKKSTISASAGDQSNTRPATTSTMTTAPTSSERAAGSRQEQAPTTTVTRKQPDAVVMAAVAMASTRQTREGQAPTTVTEPAVAPCTGQQPESVEEKVCKVRVRLVDGRVVTKEFGSQCAVAALFAYCRSMLGAGGAPPEKPFRLLRFVGRATEEIGDHNASFESLGLHLTTVSVHLG
ncbi:unnamed protein product [Miscanthus lutarioriparius]|uniref:UBX domain-containing protein n=1 Tax=Miscanthus lutarioriparius TaxID=422564 RepID=A0A811NA19_9POAL|nr:unnamed protein product [Miscanthus lutarioriparius]